MPLEALRAPPTFMSAEDYAVLQQSTPASFEGHPPVLRLKLEGVRCTIEPTSALPGEARQTESNGSVHGPLASEEGVLWVTEGALSFLTSTSRGFTLDYPTLSLHAVSRTLPDSLIASSSRSAADVACVYCQLDESQGDDVDQEEDEDESGLSELWILPADQDSMEPLFEALSYCASLHPSGLEDEEGGHPFAGIGPFGTGASSLHAMAEDGAYDDAEEGEQELSEAGRVTLAHLDSLIEWTPASNSSCAGPALSPTASFHSSDPRKAEAVEPTDTIILVNLPQEVFQMPELASSLLDLLHAYGDMVRWTPLPSFGRALVQYKEVAGANRAKEALDKLLLPVIEEGDEEGEMDAPPTRKTSDSGDTPALRAYFGPHSSSLPVEGSSNLPVPATDRNFLISPPGSPPVGWEPVREDPPNTDTLADDLIKALGSLRDRGLGVESHSPRPLRMDDDEAGDGNAHAQRLPPPPSLVIPPSTAPARSSHPLATQRAMGDGEGFVSIPGVTVQSVDPEADDDAGLDQRLNKGLSITGVKATVESMRGASAGGLGANSDGLAGSGNKITPTGRPPLA